MNKGLFFWLLSLSLLFNPAAVRAESVMLDYLRAISDYGCPYHFDRDYDVDEHQTWGLCLNDQTYGYYPFKSLDASAAWNPDCWIEFQSGLRFFETQHPGLSICGGAGPVGNENGSGHELAIYSGPDEHYVRVLFIYPREQGSGLKIYQELELTRWPLGPNQWLVLTAASHCNLPEYPCSINTAGIYLVTENNGLKVQSAVINSVLPAFDQEFFYSSDALEEYKTGNLYKDDLRLRLPSDLKAPVIIYRELPDKLIYQEFYWKDRRFAAEKPQIKLYGGENHGGGMGR